MKYFVLEQKKSERQKEKVKEFLCEQWVYYPELIFYSCLVTNFSAEIYKNEHHLPMSNEEQTSTLL